MDIAEARRRINEIENENEREVGKLFLDIEFDLVDCNAVIKRNNREVGEIDLIFDYNNYLFLIEVSKQRRDISRKIDHFFSRWSDRGNLYLIFGKYSISPMKTIRIYFDLSRETTSDPLESLDHHINNNEVKNEILYSDDFDYFKDAYNNVDKWARNDLLSFLDVPTGQTSERVNAIQYYIAGLPVFAFVASAYSLLNSCYVFRRVKRGRLHTTDKGYQRALELGRIGAITKAIQNGTILPFPNSILINSLTEIGTPTLPEYCPELVSINFPTNQCSCRIIDGQHRLLGFAKADERTQKSYYLPVIAFQNLDTERETKTFIEINSKQKKMNSNLILLLKSDFRWEENTKEFRQKIAVKVIERLSEHTLKGKIYFGEADDKPGGKITLRTLVSAIVGNNLIGGSLHLFQRDIHDVETPYERIKGIFGLIETHLGEYSFGSNNPFFVQNKGLRLLFRFIQLYERNRRMEKISLEINEVFQKISEIITLEFINNLNDYYGEGGASIATEVLVEELKRGYSEFNGFETDLRNLKVSTTSS